MLRTALCVFLFAAVAAAATGGPTVPLYNAAQPGIRMPVVGLGTFGYGVDKQGDNGELWNNTLGYNATTAWIKLGGRRIDSAVDYVSQKGVGQAIKDSGIKREELFFTSKTDPSGYNDTMAMWENILSTTQVGYVDLLLLHWPGPCLTKGLEPKECRQQAWAAATDIFKSGKARAIGVSNFEERHIEDILEMDGLIPSVNQFEFHSYWHEEKLRAWCQSRNISVQSYSPTGANDHMAFHRDKWPVLILEQPLLAQIGKKYGKSPAQVAFRWALQKNITINPRTYKPDHMKENLDLWDFELTDADMQGLDNLPNQPEQGKNKVCPDPNQIP